LVESSMFLPHDDVSVLGILVSLHIHNLSTFIDNEGTLVSEELEPS
jgi:hypothetical protein